MPIFEYSGQWAAKRVPIDVSASEQATFPSAALGLSVKPGGSVTLVVRISEDDGVVALCGCGTLSTVSRPDAVSARSVVGFTEMLGLKLIWLHPVVGGYGADAWSALKPP